MPLFADLMPDARQVPGEACCNHIRGTADLAELLHLLSHLQDLAGSTRVSRYHKAFAELKLMEVKVPSGAAFLYGHYFCQQ